MQHTIQKTRKRHKQTLKLSLSAHPPKLTPSKLRATPSIPSNPMFARVDTDTFVANPKGSSEHTRLSRMKQNISKANPNGFSEHFEFRATPSIPSNLKFTIRSKRTMFSRFVVVLHGSHVFSMVLREINVFIDFTSKRCFLTQTSSVTHLLGLVT